MGNSKGSFGISVMVMSVMLLINIHQVHGGGNPCGKEGESCEGDCCSGWCTNDKCVSMERGNQLTWEKKHGTRYEDEKLIEYVADILDGKW